MTILSLFRTLPMPSLLLLLLRARVLVPLPLPAPRALRRAALVDAEGAGPVLEVLAPLAPLDGDGVPVAAPLAPSARDRRRRRPEEPQGHPDLDVTGGA